MNIDEFKALVIKKVEEFVEKNPSIKTTYRWDQDKYFQFRTERACFRENTHYELRIIPPQNGEQSAHFVIEYHFEKKDAVRENFKKIVREYFSDSSKYFLKKKVNIELYLWALCLRGCIGTLWRTMQTLVET